MARGIPRWARGLLLAGVALLVLASLRAAPVFPLHASATPTTLVLQPDAANGTDTSLFTLTPTWNFGDNTSLWVGPNATTGNLARSLLSFDVRGVPRGSAILNATLAMYAAQGTGGSVQVRRVTSPWREGFGGHAWTTVPVTVRETAGVNRTLEPIGVTVPFAPNSIANPVRDLRVYANGQEVPSQVYNEKFASGQITSADVFFDVTLGAYQSRSFAIVYSTNATSIPPYRQPTWGTSPLWTSNATGGGASGVTIADLNGDGRLEIVFGGTDGYVYCLDDQGNLVWRTRLSATQSIPFAPLVADMNRSGQDSIIAVTNDPSIVRLDQHGNVVWQYNASTLLYTGGTLADVNGDGVLDVLLGGNFRQVIALDGRTGNLIQQYPVGGAGYTPTIVTLNGSTQPVLAFDGYDKNVHVYTLGGTQLWANAPTGTSVLENTLAYGDLSGDGLTEFVTGDFANSGNLFALYASNGSVVWTANAGKGFAGGLTLADLNHDGKLETVLGDISGGMYAFSATGAPMWTYSAGSVEPGTPAVADLTKGGSPDIVYIEGTSVVVVNANGIPLHTWSITANNQNTRSGQVTYTGPAIADLTGNGTLEVLVPTGNGIQAFATGGLDHDWRAWGYNRNHTQRALDGASGTGAPLLTVSLGSALVHPATGASWNYEDGVSPWSLPGGDMGSVEAAAAGTVGWTAWNLTSLVQGWVSGSTPNHGLILTEGSEVSGVLHRFFSSDSSVASERPILTITYVTIAGETPPLILGRIPDLLLQENDPPRSFDLTAYAFDNSTPLGQLRWNVTGFNTSVIQLTGLNVPGNANLTVYPQPGAWGDSRVTYWLSDPGGGFARQNAWINVTHMDQPPTFSPPGVLQVRYGQTYRFDFGPYIGDSDTPRSSLLFTADDPSHAVASGFNVSFTYPAAYQNTWAFVNLTVSDRQYSVTRVVAVFVTADFPPVLGSPLPDLAVGEGQTLSAAFNLEDHFSDPEGDTLAFASFEGHVNVTIRGNGSVDVRAPWGWWGVDPVTFRAMDPAGGFAEDTIRVTVLHADQPPAIGPVPNLRVRYDTPYSFNLDPYLSDPDTPVSLLTVKVSDPFALVSGHLITFLYPSIFNNTVRNVDVSVSDGLYTVTKPVWVTIGSDWPPELVRKMPDTTFLEGTQVRGAYNLSQYFTDPDRSILFWSSGNRSVLVTIHANGSVDLAAVPFWHGAERVTFRATDALGALQEDSVWITVLPVNHAPYFRTVPTQTLNVTTAYLFLTPYLEDPDGNVTDLMILDTNSSHATIIGQGLLLRFTADTVAYIHVTVSDGDLTNSTTIEVVVRLAGPADRILEVIPPWLYWALVPAAGAAAAGFVVYRRRQLEWAFLVTVDGLLVSSVSRRGPGDIDTDLVTGMFTAIMDFTKQSFSDEKERHLDGLEMGDKRVSIVRGRQTYLAVVYRGRTSGRLLSIMRSLLEKIEREHGDDLGDIIDTSKLGEIPLLLQRLVSRGNMPFVSFGRIEATDA